MGFEEYLSPEPLIGLALVITTISFQWWRRRKATVPNISIANIGILKVHLQQTGAARGLEVDYVIVGAGPAGAAALETLVASIPATKTVAILEQGQAFMGDMSHAMSFSHELIGTNASSSVSATLPLKSSIPDGPCARYDSSETALSASPENAEEIKKKQKEIVENFKGRQVPYPRGQGVGGCSGLDWGVHFGNGLRSSESFQSEQTVIEGGSSSSTSLIDKYIRSTLSFASLRSPLSWAFAEAAKDNFNGKLALALGSVSSAATGPKDGEEVSKSCVAPCLLRVDSATGFRSNPSALILERITKRPNVFFFDHIQVDWLERGEDEMVNRVIAGVVMTEKGAEKRLTFSIIVRPGGGVILAAGVLNTPLILQRSDLVLSKSEASLPFVDSIGYPIIFEARPGMSDDVHNVHSLKALFVWMVAQKGPVLNVVTDTMVVLDIGAQDEPLRGAQLLVQFVPIGGFDKNRFARLGLTRPLGVFKDGVTFYVSLYKLPTCLKAAISQNGFGKIVAAVAPLPARVDADIPKEVSDVLVNCLAKGFDFAREVMTCEPLASLTTGKEALDITLFAPQDAVKVYKTLTTTAQTLKAQAGKTKFARPPRKGSAPPPTLDSLLLGAQIGKAVAQTDEYKMAYVAKHSHFMGFGSSTAEPYLLQGSRGGVKGMRNVFVADPSATPRIEAVFDCGFHRAAGVDGAMIAGRDAAEQLLSGRQVV